MATEIAPNEGKDWIATHAISGASLWVTLIKAVSVGAGTITATSTRSGLAADEFTGTGFARIAITLGASSNGIIDVPSKTFGPTASTDWPNNGKAYALVSAATLGVFIYIWDMSTTRDMSAAATSLILPDNSLFLFNVGES